MNLVNSGNFGNFFSVPKVAKVAWNLLKCCKTQWIWKILATLATLATFCQGFPWGNLTGPRSWPQPGGNHAIEFLSKSCQSCPKSVQMLEILSRGSWIPWITSHHPKSLIFLGKPKENHTFSKGLGTQNVLPCLRGGGAVICWCVEASTWWSSRQRQKVLYKFRHSQIKSSLTMVILACWHSQDYGWVCR